MSSGRLLAAAAENQREASQPEEAEGRRLGNDRVRSRSDGRIDVGLVDHLVPDAELVVSGVEVAVVEPSRATEPVVDVVEILQSGVCDRGVGEVNAVTPVVDLALSAANVLP